MKCPACDRELQRKMVGSLEVDVCDGGCGGIWFDNHELQKVDEQHEGLGEELLNIAKAPDSSVDYEAKRECPHCDGQKMRQHYASAKKQIAVDECPACGGIWLDASELGGIRQQFTTDAERTQAAREYFGEAFDTDIAAMRATTEAKVAWMHKFKRFVQFLVPGY